MNWAGKFSQKSGLSLEDCTISITKKKFLLFFSKYYLSIAFNPLEEEIQQNTLATDNSQFLNPPDLTIVTIQATVADDNWMYFYPGVVYLKNVTIKEPLLSKNPPKICRLVVFEHENVGYYEKDDEIEIRGLVQFITNPPYDVVVKSHLVEEEEEEKFAQIIVGTSENYGNEYVKNLGI